MVITSRVIKVGDYMYYFSPEFIEGLETKSDGFQMEFYGIIDAINYYLDDEEDEKDFHQYIEEHHSFSKPGNILYHSKKIFGGTYREDEYETLKEKVHHFLLGLFDNFSASTAMVQVPHLIVCISAPDGCFEDEDADFIEKLCSFERICRGYNPVVVTTVITDTSNGRGNSCFVAAIK